MNNQMCTLLMTRPQAVSETFWHGLPPETQAVLDLCCAPLLSIEPFRFPNLAEADGLILTSAQAVPFHEKSTKRRDFDVYCVGPETAQAAGAAGFSARNFGGDANTLVSALIQDRPTKSLVHLHGRHTRGHIAERLRQAGLNVQGHAIYNQVAMPLSNRAKKSIESENCIVTPVFSPRTAKLFVQALTEIPLRPVGLHLIAISSAVADVLRPLPSASLTCVDRPDRDAMRQAVCDVATLACRVEGITEAK